MQSQTSRLLVNEAVMRMLLENQHGRHGRYKFCFPTFSHALSLPIQYRSDSSDSPLDIMAVPLDMDDSKIQIPDDYTKQLLAQLGFMEYTDTSRHEADFEKKYRSYWENHQPRCGSNKSGIHYKKCPVIRL